MATTLTSRGKIVMGNGLVMDYGDWTATDTSTATLSVSGGYVSSVEFWDASQNPCSNAGTTSTITLSAKALSGSVTSYTVTPGGTAVTNGTYQVIHGGM
jgi:hypothetical protein